MGIGDLTCKWKQEDYESNTWVGECGIRWYFEYDTPTANGAGYCPKCGKLIEEVKINEIYKSVELQALENELKISKEYIGTLAQPSQYQRGFLRGIEQAIDIVGKVQEIMKEEEEIE